MQPGSLRHHPYAPVFWPTLAITAIAHGAAFLPAYAIDDYALSLQESPIDSRLLLAQGRFGVAILIKLLHWLQLEPQHARVFFVGFALVVWAFLATLVVRHWHLRAIGWLPVAAAGMIASHPFVSEIFTFRTALGTSMCAFALLGVALLPRRWSARTILAAAAAFAGALSIYQLVLHYAGMIVLLGIAIGLTRLLVAAGRVPPRRLARLWSWRGMLRSRNSALLAACVLGSAGYLLINTLLVKLFQVTMFGRSALIAPGEARARLEAVYLALYGRFVRPDSLLNLTAKTLLGLLLALALLGLLSRIWRWPRPRALALGVAVVGVLAIAVVWSLGVLLVLQEFWPTARVMSHSGVLWAGVVVIAFHALGRPPRRLLGLVAGLALLAFVGSSNRVLHDQIRINVRDGAKANRIIDRLENLPGFSGQEMVVVLGLDYRYPLPFGTLDHDTNISAFGAAGAKESILRELSGYRLGPAPGPESAALEEYCKRVRPWPGPESVALQNGVVVVCLESD